MKQIPMAQRLSVGERVRFITSQIHTFGKWNSPSGYRKITDFIREQLEEAISEAREQLLNEQKCKDCGAGK